VGWHFENWDLQLERHAGNLSGRFTRSVPALTEPLSVKGTVGGQTIEQQGQQCYSMTLENAARQNRSATQLKAVNVVIVRTESRLRAWAVAGSLNSMSHEVDPSQLRLNEDGSIDGKVVVIFRDDQYLHLNEDTETAVAATYEIKATLSNDKIEGRYTGLFGHSWSREGKIKESMASQ
jgi:hypothetical protein